ncbi:BTB/POZ protein [Rhizophagus irregularis DAOM 181602=DAOM 197198]|nr:BTB/POZ protein [Rhizophagus irregularis DAOM 181602=DAOM 197198]
MLNNDGILAHIKLSDISPEIFQIILKYIYGGIIFFNEQETLEILKVLIAADKLHLQELVDYLQKYLIENKVELMKQNFGLVYQTRRQLYENLLNSYLDPNIEPSDNILLPRYKNVDGDNFKVPILSHVNPKDINGALFYHTRSGPTFGRDLYIGVKGVDSDEYHRNYCRKYRYEKEIRNTEDLFSIEDYEVFQIVKS